MSFWAETIKPGQKKALTAKLEEGEVLHLSQICLHDPKPGKTHLQVEVKGKNFNVACLETNQNEHDMVDLFFDDASTVFLCKGTSEIHIMGYIEPRSDDMMSESDDAAAPPARIASPKAVASSSPKAKAAASPKAAPQAEQSDDDLEDEEEEEDDLDLEDEEEEDEGESGEDDEVSKQLQQKRKAPDTPSSPAAKKAKSPKRDVPASPKVNNPDLSSEKAAYVKQLLAHLKANGKANTSTLGSKIPRPAGLPKLKVILEENKDKFTVVGDMVTAK